MKCRTTKKSRRVLTFSFTAFLLALLTANELYVNERRLLNDKINLKYRTFDEDSASDAVTDVATPNLHSSNLDSSPRAPLLPGIEPKTATQPKRPAGRAWSECEEGCCKIARRVAFETKTPSENNLVCFELNFRGNPRYLFLHVTPFNPVFSHYLG